jgi:peptide/nickel transport system substrate-binding protein
VLRSYTNLATDSRQDLFFNFRIDTAGGNDLIGSGKLDGQGIPPDFFLDVHVRKAFNYCFDWDAYIRGALGGAAAQSYDVMLPGEIGYSDHDPHYSYDPARCQAEFQASTLKGTDGRSLWDTGFHLSVPYVNGNDVEQAMLGILSKDLKTINARFEIQPVGLPVQAFVADQDAHKPPIYVGGWVEDFHDSHDWAATYVTGVFGQWQSLPLDLVQQLNTYVSEGVTETDPAKRAAIYHQFNQVFFDAAPDILLAVPQTRIYMPRWVQGYYYNPILAGYYFYALWKQ